MTLEQVNMLTHYRNASGMTYRERMVWDMAVFRAISEDGKVDISEIMQQCAGVSTDVVQFIQTHAFPDKMSAAELYGQYTAWSGHPVTATKFGREVKALGIDFMRTNNGIVYYFNKTEGEI